jgi:methylated-DNA-[protein]-cysteine S-methyltransferase
VDLTSYGVCVVGYTRFDTAVGRCAIAWGGDALTGVWLPEADARTETAPPPWVQDAIDAICALLDGQDADLGDVPLDQSGVSDFARSVYEAARTIAPGQTLTYGEIADRIGAPGEARAVGWALGRNPFPVVVPCHRVVAASGKLGGFSAPGGTQTKLRLLAIEAPHGRTAGTLF